MSNRFTIALDKLRFCFSICTDLSSFTRLVIASRDFSNSRNRNAVIDQTDQYHVKVAGRKASFILRRFAGDLDIFFEVFWKRAYEISNLQKKNISIVLDLGANAGMTAAYFFSHFPNAAFYCVEPDPENFRLLEANLNGLIPQRQLHLLRAAVGERSGRGELVSSRYSYNQRVVEQEKGDVSLMTMQSIFEHFQLSHVDLVKIDIEGAEDAILEVPGWLKKVRYLFVEFHSEKGLTDGVAKLTSAGFQWKKCAGNEMLVFAENTIF